MKQGYNDSMQTIFGHKGVSVDMKRAAVTKNKGTLKHSVGVISFIILLGILVTSSMYYLIQKNFLHATRNHEMELMQVMEMLGSQLMDSRFKSLKTEVEFISIQYGNDLLLASDEEREKILSSIALGKDGLSYSYQTHEKEFWGEKHYKNLISQSDLAPVWEGETILFSPDFYEDGEYVMAVAAPIWENSQKKLVTGILIKYMDGYAISRWMGDLFTTLNLGTAYIVNSEGRNIATAKEENYDWITTRYNAQELVKEQSDEATKTIARLEKRALDGKVGIDTYEWEGSLSYVAYGPLEEVNWGFYVGFYGDQFEGYAREVTIFSTRFAGILVAGLALIMILILLSVLHNLRSEHLYNELLLKQKEEIEHQTAHIAASEERFRIAMRRSRDIILECQLETGEIVCFFEDKEIKSGRIGDASLRTRLVEGFSMDEEGFGRFAEAMRAICRGLTNAEGMISGNCAGEKKWYSMSLIAVPNGSHKPTRAVGILRDVTGELEAELDPLTKLYNKSTMTKNTKTVMKSHLPNTAGAFVMIDVDHFKTINDQYGHPVGDQVLQEIAESMRAAFPEPYLSGRFGGDEFCICCPKIPNAQDLEKRLNQLSNRVKEIKVGDEETLTVSLSIGAVIFYGQTKFEETYAKADKLLYKAKKAGRDRYFICEIR